MRNNLLIALTVALSFGCVSTDNVDHKPSNEQLLLQTNNYQKLIPLYKERFAKSKNAADRLNLAEAYLKSGDPDSALFTLTPLTKQANKNAHVFIVKAHSHHELGELQQALNSAETANTLEANNPEVENLLAMLYVANGDYTKARTYFNLSREHLYDVAKIKNNLAALDIIEGRYKEAAQLLLPLYAKGNSDPQIKANLLLAMAKLEDYQYVQSQLASKYSQREIEDMYLALKNSKPITSYPKLIGNENNQKDIPQHENK